MPAASSQLPRVNGAEATPVAVGSDRAGRPGGRGRDVPTESDLLLLQVGVTASAQQLLENIVHLLEGRSAVPLGEPLAGAVIPDLDPRPCPGGHVPGQCPYLVTPGAHGSALVLGGSAAVVRGRAGDDPQAGPLESFGGRFEVAVVPAGDSVFQGQVGGGS